ncbi:hypothetical protein A3L04_00420 [Thermococcus chitonophagus]|uniref:Uncharacterized protein n=1 Tax=Thermococcus chitonophagus TaxID=54262 RepID=A0A160VPY6_9EURY|nr:hypothetical protein [Thermococcus chitonophagus]ASJ15646.1 hypothetical protein A3L04_00420 [Thermococcus chitonophagus]CUX76855.1 hypothetical protein CHITON_0076 [Thermococcus chitonophagus]
MPILGHNIVKIEVEKFSATGGKVEVSINPKIENLRLGELQLPTGRVKGIEVEVSYMVNYTPEVAKSVVRLILFYVPRAKEEIDKILDEWEDKKQLPGELVAEVVNFTTSELMPLMMMLSKEMRIPYPIPIPRVVVKQE